MVGFNTLFFIPHALTYVHTAAALCQLLPGSCLVSALPYVNSLQVLTVVNFGNFGKVLAIEVMASMPEVAMVPTQVVCKMMRSPLDAVPAL